ncbi:dihydrolipoyl dehydrogenase [bacterium]|nr:dihydrolipoyl dehydrogenase [bacterium]
MEHIVIIGAGPGGYHTAIRAAQKGFQVTLVEKERVGGVCLNVGCIPTKALYRVAKGLLDLNEKNSSFGIQTEGMSFDFSQTQKRKDDIVNQMVNSVNQLLKKHQIRVIEGKASLKPDLVVVNSEEIKYDHLIIATGSSPLELPFFNIDHKNILDSTDLLNIDKVPSSLIILGGGVMGVEFATIFSAFGSKVTIVELEKQILPSVDKLVATQLAKILKLRGIEIITGVKASKIGFDSDGAYFELDGGKTLKAEKALISIGRKYNSDIEGIESCGIELTDKKAIKVDQNQRTSNSKIFAIGDVTGGMLLAHVASYEGERALKAIMNEENEEYQEIPAAIFSIPEVASVGKTSQNSSEKLQKGMFSYGANGKAMALSEEEGLLLVYADENDYLAGATIMGAEASNLIQIVKVALRNRMRLSDFVSTVFPHPTLSEVVLEGAEDIHGEAIHKFSPKK